MKWTLIVSVACNLGLAGALLWFSAQRQMQTGSRGNALPVVPPGELPVPAQTQPAETAALQPAFRWNQLESTNYLDYIANLRRIGCPEKTIRDLILAEVDALYAPRREQLNRRSVQSAEDTQLRLLSEEESRLVNYLLHPENGVPVASSLPVPADTGTTSEDMQGVQIPVFIKMSSANPQWGDEQAKAVEQVRQWFEREIGGPNQDPNDPQYRRRWEELRPRADNMLIGLIGLEAWWSYCRSLQGSDS